MSDLFNVIKKLPGDFQPYGERDRDADWGPDCSCDCKWFSPLRDHPYDYGVCLNTASPRAGLLTFEHQGCKQFEEDPLNLEDLGSTV